MANYRQGSLNRFICRTGRQVWVWCIGYLTGALWLTRLSQRYLPFSFRTNPPSLPSRSNPPPALSRHTLHAYTHPLRLGHFYFGNGKMQNITKLGVDLLQSQVLLLFLCFHDNAGVTVADSTKKWKINNFVWAGRTFLEVYRKLKITLVNWKMNLPDNDVEVILVGN